MLPPPCSELSFIMRGGDGESLALNFVTEDAKSAPGVEVGSNDQNPPAFHLSQTLGRVVRFVAGREPENGAYAHRSGPGAILRVLCRQLLFFESEDLNSGWNIKKDSPSISFIKKLESARRTVIRLSRQHDNHVRRLGSVHHQDAACLGCERQRGEQHAGKYPKTPFPSQRAYQSAPLSANPRCPICALYLALESRPRCKIEGILGLISPLHTGHLHDDTPRSRHAC